MGDAVTEAELEHGMSVVDGAPPHLAEVVLENCELCGHLMPEGCIGWCPEHDTDAGERRGAGKGGKRTRRTGQVRSASVRPGPRPKWLDVDKVGPHRALERRDSIRKLIRWNVRGRSGNPGTESG